MSVKEDRDEFNQSGVRGLIQKLVREGKREIFIKLAPGGWIGDEVPERPAPGSGPYIHSVGGEAWTYLNESPTDTRREKYRIFL